MKHYFKFLVMVLAIVLIFASVGIPVGAQEGIEGGTTSAGEVQTLQGAGTNAAVPGGPGFIMLHPTAFVPMDSATEYQFGPGGVLLNSGSFNGYYVAAVNVPQGATINKVVLYYFDNASDNIVLTFNAINLDVTAILPLASVTTIGAPPLSGVIGDTTITEHTIDNQSYAYWVEVQIPAGYGTNLTIRGIRIDYSYPVNLPLINK